MLHDNSAFQVKNENALLPKHTKNLIVLIHNIITLY